ncbi:unnamed protein product, partial [Pylaiella littoralis]
RTRRTRGNISIRLAAPVLRFFLERNRSSRFCLQITRSGLRRQRLERDMAAMMRTSNRWLGLLGAAVVWSSAGVLAFSSANCIENFFADADCDIINNTEECGYDSGDCCACTCEDTADRACGVNGFVCIDPEASCVSDDDITVDMLVNCFPRGISDGFCDQDNNSEECGYDGGDCCPCTCDDANNVLGYGDSCTEFACIDPDAPCVNDDDATVDKLEACFPAQGIGNGYCDMGNNKEECGFDGGDCCECTCEDRPNQKCGQGSGFACIDPGAVCVNDDDVTVDMIDNCWQVTAIGNGYCDESNNKAECNYDGGDCCECTCDPTKNFWDDDGACGRWSLFACIDPAAECVDDDSVTADMIDICSTGNIGDGYCSPSNNSPECAYDGGDCCECTCVPHVDATDDDFSCTQFACIDPEAACVNDDDVTVDKLENCGFVLGIGDGTCESGNNNEECAFDGGDCCECTCENPFGFYWACDEYYNRFDCKDTSAPCYGEEYIAPIEADDDSMSYEFVSWEDEESLPTVDGAVEIGTKIEVRVSATAYDARPGVSNGESGCGDVGGDGCAPANSRDGISSDMESRWSCASYLVDGEGPCQIEYTFGEPQDIVDIQVAFWKENERTRTLEVHLDGVLARTHESYYTGSTYDTLGVQATSVSTVMLEPTDLLSHEWISLIEVSCF